jgi:hypothetical protein
MPLAPHLRNSLNQTNLDVENSQPQGGPNSFPSYNHTHKYSPSNTYLDSRQEEREPVSEFGINNTQIQQQNIFKNGTGLDIENPGPGNSGGPNRASAGTRNIPNGVYQTTTTQGPLMDKNGNIINNMVHQYLPTNEYKNSFNPGDLPANSTF